MVKGKEISFAIQDKVHTVKESGDIGPNTTLNMYLRDYAHLKGTKYMCREGGCGACVVSAVIKHPITKKEKTVAINSCLVPILACHGWNISTVEGIGNRKIGYHPVQRALALYNGTQCGYCSGGMVMNMYALYQSKSELTMEKVENSFGGNLCRCTGYRSILDGFKSLCSDADPDLINKFPDIEDIKICSLTKKNCNSENCKLGLCDNEMLNLTFNNAGWYKVYNIESILELFKSIEDSTYRFAAGNTGKGVYKIMNNPSVYIDITSVPELVSHSVGENLTFGANVSLTEVMDIILKLSLENPNFWYLKKVYDHLDVVANVPIRNIGTLAGNLSMKYEHNEFPSDIFLLLETLNCQLEIVEKSGSVVKKSILEYLTFDMNKCFIKSVIIPPYSKDHYIFDSYKITPRVQNAHAYVNAAFLIEFEKDDVIKKARIVYGGINPDFNHAIATEKYLIRKNLYSNETIQGALKTLNDEINPDLVLPDASPKYRKNVALALFYKFVLNNAPTQQINPRYVSGGYRLQRPVSAGTQTYTTNKNQYPLTQPVPKVEGLIQCSGEIQYISDIPDIPNQLYGAFILAETEPLCMIKEVNTAEALALPGVVEYICKKDIIGSNSFIPTNLSQTKEEIFCSGKVLYNGQAVGLILATTHEQAIAAAKLVKIHYVKNTEVPLYSIKDVLNSDQKWRIEHIVEVKPKRKGNNIKHVIHGIFDIGGQYHFTMETQGSVCVPTDDGGLDIYAGTQWMDLVHCAASQALNMPQNKINVSVRRLGGGYGAKIFRSSLISTACAVAANKINKPVRVTVPLEENMKMIGKRYPINLTYEAGVDDNGVIQYLDIVYYHDAGSAGYNENPTNVIPLVIKNCYNFDTWQLSGSLVKTDMPGNCFCRAPGSTESIAIIEHIMDHISMICKKDQASVRLANIPEENKIMSELIKEIIEWSGYNKRRAEINDFNSNNRWVKKGISLVAMTYPFEIFGNFSVFVSVYALDGTVSISHGGVECGQGINTKVVQVCAHMLNIPMDMISIKSTNTLNSPNNMQTGGSITSEACCYATMEACKELLRRLEPYREIKKNTTWQEIIMAAHEDNVELCATHMYSKKSNVGSYEILGVCVTEVEVDILTGEHNITRVDLIEDTGSSMSPEIDVGQVEGAFIMGLGYWTCEKLVYDEKGGLLTNNTWTYKIPGVKEIPNNFRIMFKKNSSNPVGVFNSKATGEPPLCLSCSVSLAIRQALASARLESDEKSDPWLSMDGPTTVEYTFLSSLNEFIKYVL